MGRILPEQYQLSGYREFTKEVEEYLSEVADSLQVPDGIFREIEKEYKDLTDWLDRPDSRFKDEQISVYTQGSFQLGTIIRPISSGDDYDIDMVCEIDTDKTLQTQEQLKFTLGLELSDYCRRNNLNSIAPKRRCWEMDYKPKQEFHIDFLPAITDGISRQALYESKGIKNEWLEYAIAITDEKHQNYKTLSSDWPHSNPKGYGEWFRSCMQDVFDQRRKAIALEERVLNADDIPVYRVQTPLQSAIQILKRHRDMSHTGEPEDKPISIIITTLAAHAYMQERTIAETLYGILSRMENYIDEKLNVPWVANPTDPEENFADKWSMPEYSHRQQIFRNWLQQAREDFGYISGLTDKTKIAELLAPSISVDTANKALNKNKNSLLGKALSVISPIHKKALQWNYKSVGHVVIKKAEYFRQAGFCKWSDFHSDDKALPKNCELRFTAETNITGDYDVYWQVVNTGLDAERAKGLRGGFDITRSTDSKLNHTEKTLYKGSHTIECFIVKDGYCLARSGEFVVNIN